MQIAIRPECVYLVVRQSYISLDIHVLMRRLKPENPMRWVNRLLYNNDKLKPIASVGGVKVTSVQAIGEERL